MGYKAWRSFTRKFLKNVGNGIHRWEDMNRRKRSEILFDVLLWWPGENGAESMEDTLIQLRDHNGTEQKKEIRDFCDVLLSWPGENGAESMEDTLIQLQSTAMEIPAAAGGEVAKSGIAHFERELGYLFHFRRNFHSLRSKTEQLTAARNDVQRLKGLALNNDELIREAVETWLVRADVAQNEARVLNEEAAPINSWIKGWFSCSRFTLGRKTDKKILAINEILAERSTFGDTISDPKPVQSLALVTAGDFSAFQSREATTERVIKALTNDAVSLVGIYGMPGVGKTVLIEALSKQVKEKKLFDEVVMVIISQNPDLKTVQGNIANQLGLRLEETDGDIVRARRLSERLQRETKILIVLDDMWERLELAKLGIPLRKNNNKGCKVIFTTRIESVCGKMETDKNIEVALLSEADSWSLFREKAGCVVDSLDHQTIARDVANECKGLPLALVTLGRALRDKNTTVWEYALVQLKKSKYEEDMSPVTISIRLSFDFLESETTKTCFLFCCLFREDFEIDIEVLLRYVTGEKISEENVCSLTDSRRSLSATLEKLVSSSLLLRGMEDHKYKMHDVVRDVAISIASTEGYGFVVKAGMNITEWPSMELNKCKRLSLMGSKIRCNLLCYQIKSPLLLTLSLNSFKDLEEIPSGFFTIMQNLLVLDLSKTRIKALPPSVANLTRLSTLLLKGCECLNNVSPIEKLERLEILDLSGSRIEIFPKEMRMLTNLKLLDLSEIETLKTIAPKVISSMRKLEELYVSFHFNGWEIEGMSGDGVNASFRELESLAHLTYLQVFVAGPEYFSNYIPDLAACDIVVTQDPDSEILDYVDKSDGPTRRRAMYLQTSDVVSVPTHGFLAQLLRKIEFLLLYRCEALESVTQLDQNGLDDNLKHPGINGCHEMKYLVNNVVAENALNSLEVLTFEGMTNLVAMCNGTLPRGLLGKLREIKMNHCSKIRTLIPCDLLVRLQNLEEIYVMNCGKMDVLIQVKGEVKAAEEEKVSHSSYTTTITTTSHPSSSASSSSAATNQSNNWNKISTLPPCPMLPNLRFLFIRGCHKLRYILPMSVVGGLVQLESIRVQCCDNVEMIIGNENDDEDDGDRDRDNNGVFPRLRTLDFYSLPKLLSFSPPGIVLNWSSLKYLVVLSCKSVKNFPRGITHQSLARINYVNVDEDLIEDPSIKEAVLLRRRRQ